MKLEIPLYYKQNDEYRKSRDKHGEQEYITLELSEYVVSLQDLVNVKELVKEFNKPTEYIDFVNIIKTMDLLPIFQEKKDKFNEDWSRIIKGVPQNIIDGIKPQRIEFQKLLARELQKSMTYLKEHVAEIEDLFRDIIEQQKNKMKQSRKDACKKYYLKKKQELNASFDIKPEKVELTEEENENKKKEARKEACKKYYLKKKQELNALFEPDVEKKKQSRQEKNRKYYLKIKQKLDGLNETQEEKPVDDLKEKKKLYNKKYYQSKKDKLLQLSKNENEQT